MNSIERKKITGSTRAAKKTAAVLFLCLALAFSSVITAYAAEEKDYTIDDVSLVEKTDGIYAQWEKAQSSTSYVIVLYRDSMYKTDQKIIRKKITDNVLDITQYVLDTGTGTYHFTVHPVKAESDYILESNDVVIEKDELEYYEKLYKDREREVEAEERKAAQASTESAPLSKVELTVSVKKSFGGRISEIGRISGSGVRIKDISYDIPFENWTKDSLVTVTAAVTADGKGYFTGDTSFSCARTEDFSYEIIDEKSAKISFHYRPRMTLQIPDGIRTKDEDRFAWSPVPCADRYRVSVYLYDESKEAYMTKSASFRLSEHDLDPEDIDRIEIEARPADGSTNLFASDKASYDSSVLFGGCTYEGTINDAGDGFRYKDEEGNTPSGWEYIADDWYYFGDDGKAFTGGWLEPGDGHKYYINSTGQMVTGEIVIDGVRYDLDAM